MATLVSDWLDDRAPPHRRGAGDVRIRAKLWPMMVRRLPLVASGLMALAILAARCTASSPMVPIYLGTYTDGASRGIYRLTLDPSNARFSDPVVVAEATNPSFLAWHPTQPVLYAVSETDTV